MTLRDQGQRPLYLESRFTLAVTGVGDAYLTCIPGLSLISAFPLSTSGAATSAAIPARALVGYVSRVQRYGGSFSASFERQDLNDTPFESQDAELLNGTKARLRFGGLYGQIMEIARYHTN